MNFLPKPYTTLALFGLLLTLVGCKDYLEINVNPNLPAGSPPNLLLAGTEGNVGCAKGADVHKYTLLWAQQLAAQNGRQTEAYDAYTLAPTGGNVAFRANGFAGPLADIKEMLKKDPATTHPFYFGISKALKAFYFAAITDLRGDVPYKEAFHAANLQPKFDASKDSYEATHKLLGEATAEFSKTSALAAPAADDYFYGGNAQRWIRMTTTKLRLYLHQLNAQAVTAPVVSDFIKANETKFMASMVDDFQLRFEVNAGKQNPIHQFILLRTDDIAVSSTIVDLMNAKADPRRARYFTPAPFSPAAVTTPPSGTTGAHQPLAAAHLRARSGYQRRAVGWSAADRYRSGHQPHLRRLGSDSDAALFGVQLHPRRTGPALRRSRRRRPVFSEGRSGVVQQRRTNGPQATAYLRRRARPARAKPR